MKKITLFGILIMVVLLVVGCTNQSPTGGVVVSHPNEPITIGALFPLTGGLAQYGEVSEKTARLIVDQINSQGGIDGQQLHLDVQDHQCDPKLAVSEFQQATQAKGIKIFTASACSGTALSIAPLLEQNDAVLLGTLLSTPKISGSSPRLFRNWAYDSKEAELFAQHIKESNYKNVGIIYEQTDYAAGLKISLEKFLEGSNVKVTSEAFATGTTDVRTQLLRLQQADIDVLFISPQTVTSGDIVLKQLSELGFNSKLIVNDNIVKSKDLVSRYAPLLESAIGGDFVIEQTKEGKEMLGKYKMKYGVECAQPNICLGVYDTMNFLSQAIDQVGTEPEAIEHYLKTSSYNGVTGLLRFDNLNDRANAEYSLFEIHNGEAVLSN
ncbi:ABC transporter substrate-binding protein [Candidatus Woesearchaeota archaeon]|nr:ABC transporter substrate-binding protein [Candidatus Woesearchaeota archaeon]